MSLTFLHPMSDCSRLDLATEGAVQPSDFYDLQVAP